MNVKPHAPGLGERVCLEGADGSDAARVVLVVVVLAAGVREVDVIGHVGRLLRRGPVAEIVDGASCSRRGSIASSRPGSGRLASTS